MPREVRDEERWQASLTRQQEARDQLAQVSANWSGLLRHWDAVVNLVDELDATSEEEDPHD